MSTKLGAVSRRSFLHQSSFGLGSVALSYLLASEGFGASFVEAAARAGETEERADGSAADAGSAAARAAGTATEGDTIDGPCAGTAKAPFKLAAPRVLVRAAVGAALTETAGLIGAEMPSPTAMRIT